MTKTLLKTPDRAAKEKQDLAILKDWNEMTSIPGQSHTMVTQALMKKYNLHSPSAIWSARRRAEKLLEQQEA